MGKLEPEAFVKRWMEAVNNKELGGYGILAEHFNVSRQYIEQYARKLKTKGVKLPVLEGGQRRAELPVKKLNNIIQDMSDPKLGGSRNG